MFGIDKKRIDELEKKYDVLLAENRELKENQEMFKRYFLNVNSLIADKNSKIRYLQAMNNNTKRDRMIKSNQIDEMNKKIEDLEYKYEKTAVNQEVFMEKLHEISKELNSKIWYLQEMNTNNKKDRNIKSNSIGKISKKIEEIENKFNDKIKSKKQNGINTKMSKITIAGKEYYIDVLSNLYGKNGKRIGSYNSRTKTIY